MRKIFAIFLLCVLSCSSILADNVQIAFSAADITVENGETGKSVSVEMTNNVPVISFYCDIILPEGITIDNNTVTLNSTRKNTEHSLMLSPKGNTLSILNVSNQNKAFKETSGELFSFDITVNKAIGSSEIKLNNIYVTTGSVATGFTEHKLDDITVNVTYNETSETEVIPTSIALNRNVAAISVDGTLLLTATTSPSETTRNIIWSSSNTEIATVSTDGVVKGISNGTAVITATVDGTNVYTNCTITVNAVTPPNPTNFEVGGIYYKTSGYNATVISVPDNTPAYSGEITIPETVTYNGTTYSVTGIEGSAFGYCSELTSVSIPNSMKNIGKAAFDQCM